jgi:hypothetical protein
VAAIAFVGGASSAVAYAGEPLSRNLERAESTMGLLCWGADVRSGLSSVVDRPCLNRGCGGGWLTHLSQSFITDLVPLREL